MPDERIPEDEPADVRFRRALDELEKKGIGNVEEIPDLDDEFEESLRNLQGRAETLKADTNLPDVPDWKYKKPEALRNSEQRDLDGAKGQRAFGLALSIGYAFVAPVLVGILIGAWIDGGLGGTGTILGLILGSVVALFLLVKLVNKLNESQ